FEAVMLTFQCTGCQRKLSLPDEHAGKKIRCPSCNNVTTAPRLTIPEPPPPPPPVAAIVPTLAPVDTRDATRAFTDQTPIDPALVNFLAPPQGPGEIGRLGKYRILSIIGQGGMGIVYKAEDSMLKRTVAIKAILPTLGVSEQIRKRFVREARVLAKFE